MVEVLQQSIPAAGLLQSSSSICLGMLSHRFPARGPDQLSVPSPNEPLNAWSSTFPPLAEQGRILDKVDELFSELDEGIESLKKARAQLATYRQAVLKHAFEGSLTTQWRERHRDLPGAEGLLQEILAERRNAWNGAQVRRPDGKVRARVTSGKQANSEPRTSCSAALPAIPRSWCWATVDQLLAEGLSNGRSVKSAERGFPVLRLTALRYGEIEQDECKIGAWTEEDAQQFLIREGDLLVSRGNGSLKLVGIGGLVRSLRSPVAYPDTHDSCCAERARSPRIFLLCVELSDGSESD